MDLTLSWDLFVIVFFALVCAYSFIIGKHQSIKIIIATYIAIVAGQGVGNILEGLSTGTQPLLSSFGLSVNITVLGGTKLGIFVAIIIFLAVKGGLEIQYSNEASRPANLALTGLFGFATAGLLLSTLLTFIANAPLMDASMQQAALSPIIQESQLMQIMIIHQDMWFSLPAILLIGVGLISNE